MPGIRPVKGGVMPSLMASPQKEGMTPAISENCKVLQHVSDNTLIRCQTDKEGLAPYEPKKERKKEETETVRFAHSLTSSDARVIDPQPKTSFENFWAAYPRRVGRASAAKAYASAIRRIDPDSLLTAVTAYCWHVDMRFIPHAATWLNGDRWLDDARAAAPAPSLSQPVNSRRMTNEEKCDALFGPSPFLQAWQSRPLTPERQHHDEATHHTIEHDFFAG